MLPDTATRADATPVLQRAPSAPSAPSATEESPDASLQVLYGFGASIGSDFTAVANNVERILAYLAVTGRPQQRMTVASTLWIDSPQERATANLRTALWKARRDLAGWVECHGSYLALAGTVHVDLCDLLSRARRLINPAEPLCEFDCDPADLAGDLLPDWDEEWVMFERERLRHLRIHALEALCAKLTRAGRHGEAIDAGLAAVAAEPLRESAQRVLMAAHLHEGNVSEARRQFAGYRDLLHEELGVSPSDTLHSLAGFSSRG